jgi:hypothetical protein
MHSFTVGREVAEVRSTDRRGTTVLCALVFLLFATALASSAKASYLFASISPSRTQNVDIWSSVVFNSTVSGNAAPYAYQWLYGYSGCNATSTPISGATSSSYAATPTNTTYYCLTVTDSATPNSVTTTPATEVTVNSGPLLVPGVKLYSDSGQWGAGTVYEGHLYYVGGDQVTGTDANVYYNNILPSGAVAGNFITTTPYPFPIGRESCVASDGYLYCAGGQSNSFDPTNAVLYAPILPSGAVGAWSATNSLQVPFSEDSCVSSSNDIYCRGGMIDSLGDFSSVVQYAPILSSGALGAWSTTNATSSFQESFDEAGAFCTASGGYIYCTDGSLTNTVVYSHILPSGALGAWSVANQSSENYFVFSTCTSYNGRIYCSGQEGAVPGSNIGKDDYTMYAQALPSGNLGAWHATYPTILLNNGAACAYGSFLGYGGYLYSYACDHGGAGWFYYQKIISLANTTAAVACNPSSVASAGSNSMCTATLSGFSGPVDGESIAWASSGAAVSLSSPSCALSSGSCSVTVTGTDPGIATLHAYYSGDGNNTESQGAATLSIGSSGLPSSPNTTNRGIIDSPGGPVIGFPGITASSGGTATTTTIAPSTTTINRIVVYNTTPPAGVPVEISAESPLEALLYSPQALVYDAEVYANSPGPTAYNVLLQNYTEGSPNAPSGYAKALAVRMDVLAPGTGIAASGANVTVNATLYYDCGIPADKIAPFRYGGPASSWEEIAQFASDRSNGCSISFAAPPNQTVALLFLSPPPTTTVVTTAAPVTTVAQAPAPSNSGPSDALVLFAILVVVAAVVAYARSRRGANQDKKAKSAAPLRARGGGSRRGPSSSA